MKHLLLKGGVKFSQRSSYCFEAKFHRLMIPCVFHAIKISTLFSAAIYFNKGLPVVICRHWFQANLDGSQSENQPVQCNIHKRQWRCSERTVQRSSDSLRDCSQSVIMWCQMSLKLQVLSHVQAKMIGTLEIGMHDRTALEIGMQVHSQKKKIFSSVALH